MEDGIRRFCWLARNDGAAGRGQKIDGCRCGRTIEAKPFSGQTCPIEPAGGWPGSDGKEPRPGRRRDGVLTSAAGSRRSDLPVGLHERDARHTSNTEA